MARALIVDDDAFLAGIYASKMEQAGYTVQVASTAKDAVHKAEATHPDVVMLDVVLAGASGLDVLSHLRQIAGCEAVPVVMVSNQDDGAIMEEAKRRGAATYLIKSYYTPSEIVARVRNATVG
jgi:two-component system alkaline phosphatase synthesis response regulator PhoP